MDPLLIVQCRFRSSRLPGKALYPLDGLPMVAFLIRRLKKACLKGRLILATTQRPEDDVVAAWGMAEKADVLRGESEDVLARYLQCLKRYPAPYVIRITADNPLTGLSIISMVCQEMEGGDWDYVSALEGFPLGGGVDSFKASLLETIAAKACNQREREHINAYVLDHMEDFRCKRLSPPIELARPDVRLTVDTIEDYQRIKELVKEKGLDLDLSDAIKRFDLIAV
jgi:spore coat polysaccharide biosynthesis protein SpsF